MTRTVRVLRLFPAIVFVLGLGAYVLIHVRGWGAGPIVSDGYSYYVYLPSWFLHGDFSLDAVARDCCGGRFPSFTAIRRWPETGRWIDPHPIGPALLMLPFFAVAHVLTSWSNLPPDGFSFYYQHLAGLAGLTYLAIGIGILVRLLSRYFSAGVVLAALVTLVFGTNLFHYGTYEPVFSHAYSFCLVAALLALTDRWWRKPGRAVSVALGAVAGLIVLARHTNAIYLIVIPLYGVVSLTSLRSAAVRLWTRRHQLLGGAAVAAATVFPQLLIYRAATDRWFVSPYAQVAGFNFASPHLAGVLIAPPKGLFFWSPALLLAVVGAAVARGWARSLRVAAVLLFAVEAILIASWQDWQFGAGFGHRGFTDGLPVAAVFLASAFDWTARHPRARPWIALATTMLVALSIAQMFQYWMHILPIANTTWPEYRHLFLRFR